MLQKMVQRGTQGGRGDGLAEQLITTCASFAQAFRGGVAADEQGGDRTADDAAQPVDGLETGLPARQLVV